ncbi:MAG: 3-hydroxyacyl-CoA dehydrogenase family protein [Ruminococcaceae bacterium]|nr:3-hydroxyacyl-CoA dehydrogenase family protein [Oscillospiraceae bacterium]
MEIKKVAILGQGSMGSSITQHAAACGYDVILWGRNGEKVAAAVAKIGAAYDKQVAKGKMEAEAAEAAKAHIVGTSNFEDIADADIVIEAISEEPALKKDYFAKMVATCKPEAILATNTSSISITEIASSVDCPERVIGMHFFNPVPLMKLVEIILGDKTSDACYDAVKAFCDGLAKISVKVKDAPGFIVNRVLFAYFLECIHIYEDGIASKEDIDNAIKYGLNHPVPPFQMMDMGGLDTFPHVCESLQTLESKGAAERFECPESMKALYAAGKFGRKAGEGWYVYNK